MPTKYELNFLEWIMPLRTHKVMIVSFRTGTPKGLLKNLHYYEPVETIDWDTASLFNNVAQSLETTFAPLIKKIIGHTASWDGVEVHFFDGAGGEWLGGANALQGLGDVGNGDELLPNQDALIIRKITGKVGRQKRGRFFFGGLPQDADVEGLISDDTIAGYVAATKDLALALHTTYLMSGVHWIPSHYDKKDDLLISVRDCAVMRALRSRRDRAKPLNAYDARV